MLLWKEKIYVKTFQDVMYAYKCCACLFLQKISLFPNFPDWSFTPFLPKQNPNHNFFLSCNLRQKNSFLAFIPVGKWDEVFFLRGGVVCGRWDE